ncbi:UTP--GlnB (protein PII) uridylyltransferase, GlnD [Thalassospira xiamenensis M-5 = DSM 17429]|uniref:Bifunctional uridylyltransferase/uridylyl-removing enzyme n=1 Tax=Thalassospira xiamenensis M-5 = DSM 17429 TaxID=1123366 RepID=A0AB72UIT1_9PROT|nr:[protein-PII] uridylyltransferase [Thalassospira xiamenensis]AJD54075.1 PII uridylyl-transferase [Thalassospira xiamenensis M-5 = DSM 17429]SIS61908.1 UTP--GlnB (protein PII) uridylyltransferase, GlnD [Thalassospira xiamenensis M-5 = DSM 17429]
MTYRIKKQREIIDRRKIFAELETIAANADLTSFKQRAEILKHLKAVLEDGRKVIRARFEETNSGQDAVFSNSFLIDQIVRLIHDFALKFVYPLHNPTNEQRMAVVAVGGYGRGDMAPQSDVDILFLFPYKQTAHGEQVVEYILYMLWDLGLKVGHATRSIDDCLRMGKQDITIRTNLLESRFVWADEEVYKAFRARFMEELVKGTGLEFIEGKLNERDERHIRMGDSRYVVEPNVKDGKGGLRDLHTLFWIGKYLYRVSNPLELVDLKVLTRKEAQGFLKAQNFLWSVRCWLHYLTGREEDRLTFDMQRDIADKLGYTDHAGASGVERFMKHYYLMVKHVGNLTRIFCAALEERHQRKPLIRFPARFFGSKEIDGFQLRNDRLTVDSLETLQSDPIQILRLFLVAHQNGVGIHPETLRWVTQSLKLVDHKLQKDPAANEVFLEILTHRDTPDIPLRKMNEAGLLGRFIPDFGRVVAQMQYDMYHTYTVDEHTIRAIGILNQIERGELAEEAPVATRIMEKVISRRVLYVAVLLHDIAKGRGGDHSELGAEVAEKLCPRLGLSPADTETVAWLVKAHLWMSLTAFKRDLNDPTTIRAFADLVQSQERLRLLLCLTVADIRAVGPNVWNGWKATLLRELFYATDDLLSGGLNADSRDSRVARAQQKLRDALAASGSNWPEQDVEDFIDRGYPSYWLSFDTETHVRHAHLTRDAKASGADITIDMRIETDIDATEIIVHTTDHPGLFSQIAGSMALCGANVVDAKILTLADGMALDTFFIQDTNGEAFNDKSKLDKLRKTLEQVISGRLRPSQEIERRQIKDNKHRTAVFKVEPNVIIDNKASRTHTVIEITARDRQGLLYDVTRTLRDLSLQIASARISTFGERAVDVFYVKDVFGLKIDSRTKFLQVKETLTQTLENG